MPLPARFRVDLDGADEAHADQRTDEDEHRPPGPRAISSRHSLVSSQANGDLREGKKHLFEIGGWPALRGLSRRGQFLERAFAPNRPPLRRTNRSHTRTASEI